VKWPRILESTKRSIRRQTSLEPGREQRKAVAAAAVTATTATSVATAMARPRASRT
jgi:hypothetical protein